MPMVPGVVGTNGVLVVSHVETDPIQGHGSVTTLLKLGMESHAPVMLPLTVKKLAPAMMELVQYLSLIHI